MEVKTNLKSIWIVTILSLGLLLFGVRECMSQPYVSFQVDANNLIGFKDNPRMVKEVNGLDYDVEVGVMMDERDGNLALYGFFGEFRKANYINYGIGLDYYLNLLKRFELSCGNFIQFTERTNEYKYLGNTVSYLNPRFKLGVDTSWITIELIWKLTKRNDIDKRVNEGVIGFKKKF